MKIQILGEKIKSIDRKIVITASIAMLIAFFAIGSMTFGKPAREDKSPADEAPLSISAITIKPQMISSMVSAAGALSSRNISVLSSKVMGRVVELNVHEGDQVGQGKLLIRIESGEITAQAYQAQAAFNNGKLHFDRIKTLYEEKAATQMEMDQATLALESARAGLNSAKAMESYTAITAPISGQIVEKKINPGEMALPGQPLLKIEDNRNLRLEAMVKEQDIRFVRAGQSVSVRIDALPDREVKGRVAQIVPAADIRTHSFIVKIDIPSDKSLITGMYGKALFNIGEREAILIPQSSVVRMAGLSGVYIVSAEGNAVFQMVQLGESHGDRIEAVTGLKPGDQVIVGRSDARIDGRKVVVAQQ